MCWVDSGMSELAWLGERLCSVVTGVRVAGPEKGSTSDPGRHV